MKETWSEDAAEIIAELQRNCDDQIAFTLLGPSMSPTFVTVRAISKNKGQVFVEFEKPEGLEFDGEIFAFYRPDDLSLMRGFKLEGLRQSNRFFRMAIPELIFEVQRRKFPRIYVAEGSSVTCAPQASRRILQAQVIDVSMEGAKIFGRLTGVTKGTIFAPLTLTLCFTDKRCADVVINIAQAVVVREIRVKEKVEVSFHFHSKNADDLLKKYIEQRILEQEI